MAGIIFSKSSGLNDSVFGKSAEPIMMFIEQKAEAFEQMSLLPKMFKKTTSKNFAEKIASMTSMDGFLPVGEGGAYPQNDIQEGYDKIIEFETWKSQFVVTQEMIEDNKMLDMKKPLGFITSYHRTREQFGANMFVKGALGQSVTMNGKTYSTKGADGKYVFATDHPAKVKGAAQTNKFSNEFSADALSAVETTMQNVKDDNGNVLNIAPDTIVIPNEGSLKKSVFAAIGADKDPDTANNGYNYQFGRWNIIVSPYLNDLKHTSGETTFLPWILLDSNYNESYGGAMWIDRVQLTVKTWVDNNTDNNVWNGRARFMAGFNDWRFAAIGGCNGGTALSL